MPQPRALERSPLGSPPSGEPAPTGPSTALERESSASRQDRSLYGTAKRVVDLVVASLMLVLLAPVFAAIAVAIKLDSPGPVLHRQTRVGREQVPFGMYKFRSMRADAEQMRRNLEHLNERNGPVFKMKDDPRRTRVGRFLRRFSLDEAPQILNVLRGEMSMVGPRPPLPTEVERYETHHYRRLEALPGITGLWQVTARDESDFEEWVRIDVEYIERKSLPLDLWIMLRTPLAMIAGKGAC